MLSILDHAKSIYDAMISRRIQKTLAWNVQNPPPKGYHIDKEKVIRETVEEGNRLFDSIRRNWVLEMVAPLLNESPAGLDRCNDSWGYGIHIFENKKTGLYRVVDDGVQKQHQVIGTEGPADKKYWKEVAYFDYGNLPDFDELLKLVGNWVKERQ